ncbi:MAG: NapC/NirT family cytochrome c [Dehalococcoidia bacterium]|nr:NapC/NirT family cytochrome c [Dehalococcoidia bacterium]
MTYLEEEKVRSARLIFLMIAGAIGIMLLVIGVYQLVEFMDSTSFCGELCHNVMYPEFTTFQASPHSRVTCSQCHVGSGADYLVRSKLSGLPLVITTITGTYDRPIPTPVENLRPARETCEQCHRPEIFLGDVVRVHTTFLQDEANTERVDTRILRIGGGEKEVARDIHWHIAAEVWYLPVDKQRQEITWVGVVDKNGDLTEYYDMDRVAEASPERVQKEARLMDCIDCHNRATHIFQSPEELIDHAVVQGRINRSLPYIKREAMKALNTLSPSLEDAYRKVEAIEDFYRASYPDVFQRQRAELASNIKVLKEIARLTTFPEMKVSWQTYNNEVSHIESPGCLRCHGKLIQTTVGPQKDKPIRDDCQLCHYFQAGNAAAP